MIAMGSLETPPAISDGLYPYNDRLLPLAELAFTESPPEPEVLLRQQAASKGIELVRDVPIKLKCIFRGQVEATFLIWWPHGEDRIHLPMPLKYVRGRA